MSGLFFVFILFYPTQKIGLEKIGLELELEISAIALGGEKWNKKNLIGKYQAFLNLRM